MGEPSLSEPSRDSSSDSTYANNNLRYYCDSQQEQTEKKIGEKTGSCVQYFDALWFCYSPVHQMQEYYRYGTVDDCSGHWGKLMDCLKKKTSRYKDSVPDDPNTSRHPVWELRTRKEATEFWKAEFGHLQDESAAAATAEVAPPGDSTAAEPVPPQRRTGIV